MRRHLNQYGYRSDAERQRAERHLTQTAPTLATGDDRARQEVVPLRPSPGVTLRPTTDARAELQDLVQRLNELLQADPRLRVLVEGRRVLVARIEA